MEASDKQIFELVMDAIQACKNLEKDGRDDHTDEDGPVHPRPSRQDVLRASISTIVQYVSDLNDPIACKAKAVLGSFKLTRFLCREESCTMKDTVLTDFFHYQQ